MEIIMKNIKLKMMKQDIKNYEMADKLGIKPPRLSNYLNNIRPMPFPFIEQIAKILKSSITELNRTLPDDDVTIITKPEKSDSNLNEIDIKIEELKAASSQEGKETIAQIWEMLLNTAVKKK